MILRPTEVKDQFWFLLGGHVDYSELLADHEKLLKALRDFVQRKDLVIGNIKYATEYRSVCCLDKHEFRGPDIAIVLMHVLSISSEWGASSWLEVCGDILRKLPNLTDVRCF